MQGTEIRDTRIVRLVARPRKQGWLGWYFVLGNMN